MHIATDSSSLMCFANSFATFPFFPSNFRSALHGVSFRPLSHEQTFPRYLVASAALSPEFEMTKVCGLPESLGTLPRSSSTRLSKKAGICSKSLVVSHEDVSNTHRAVNSFNHGILQVRGEEPTRQISILKLHGTKIGLESLCALRNIIHQHLTIHSPNSQI